MNIVKYHLRQVSRAYKGYQRKVGTTVTWYEFDEATTEPSDFYDEAPSVAFKNGFQLPILSIIRDEDREQPREEGLYTFGRLHLSFSVEQAKRVGMTDPVDSYLHLRDRFFWDGEYWQVTTYQISGRLNRHEVIVGVDAARIADEELVNYPSFPPTPGR